MPIHAPLHADASTGVICLSRPLFDGIDRLRRWSEPKSEARRRKARWSRADLPRVQVLPVVGPQLVSSLPPAGHPGKHSLHGPSGRYSVTPHPSPATRASAPLTKRIRPGGIVAEDPKSYDLPASAFGDGPHPPILLEAFERAGNQFREWDAQVAHTGWCCRPIHITGKVEQVDKASGEVRAHFTTATEPDNTLLVACGSRKATKCRSCSSWYQRDAFHLVRAGLEGGARGSRSRWASIPRYSSRSRRRPSGRCTYGG